MEANVPSGRFAKPEEVAFSINGVNLPVDGGLAASL
jgi:hypothetical protein